MKNNKKYTTLHVSGMTCNNCAMGIEKQLIKHGIKEVSVDFSNSEASFQNDNAYSVNDVITYIENSGFKASYSEYENDHHIERLFLICLIFTIPLFSHMFLGHGHILQNPIVQFSLCLPVFIIGINYFGKSALSSLKNGLPNMDVLITMGSSAAFFYSIIGVSMHWGTNETHSYLFFETTATIITLVMLGNVLEHRSVKKTTTAIQELSSIQQSDAKKENKDGSIISIPFEEICINDLLVINMGDKIPTDGNVVEGDGFVDESMINGENNPIHKTKDHNLIGGTILIEGHLKMIAKKVGSETLLSQIIKLVKQAQREKPKIQLLGDKVSNIFVPSVLFIAALTFIINFLVFDITLANSFMRSIAVLVISCPCAMGLATPTAVMVGLGRAAKNGILIKGGNTLEEFAKIKNIVFDKTGTLTTGRFKIKKIDCDKENLQLVKNIIYSLELNSSHPIAKSIVNELKNESTKIDITEVSESKGKGIEGLYKGDEIKLGNTKFLGINTDEKANFYLSINDKLIGAIYCEDELKSNVDKSISLFQKNMIQPIMLSGDSEEKCKSLAHNVGIKNYFSNKLPDQKLDIISTLNKEALTAMVGDGINDGPALTKAHVGVSMSNGTQVAVNSAQIVLLRSNDFIKVFEAYLISKHTLKTIKQNLFWAFSYNIVAIPIAAIGLLNPMWAALFMAFSDVVVIGNSIRLKNKKLT